MADDELSEDLSPRDVIESWAAAVRGRDIDGVLANHGEKMRFFDVPFPVQSRGLDSYARSWMEQFFVWFGDRGGFQLDELEVVEGVDVAFAHALLSCHGSKDNEPTEELALRLTVGLQRIDNRWVIRARTSLRPEPLIYLARSLTSSMLAL